MAEGTLKPVGGAPFPVDKGMDKETVKGVAAGIAALRMHLRYQEAADGEAAAELQEMADREGAEQLQKKKDGEPPMKYRKVGLRDGCLDYILKKLESGQWEHVGFQSADIMAFMKWYPDDTSMENLVKLADRGMRDMKDDLRDKGLGSFVPVSNDVVEELRRLLAPGPAGRQSAPRDFWQKVVAGAAPAGHNSVLDDTLCTYKQPPRYPVVEETEEKRFDFTHGIMERQLSRDVYAVMTEIAFRGDRSEVFLHLYGPAGTGKSHALYSAAIALRQKHGHLRVPYLPNCEQWGRSRAAGQYFLSAFRDAFIGDSEILNALDAVDAENEGAVCVLFTEVMPVLLERANLHQIVVIDQINKLKVGQVEQFPYNMVSYFASSERFKARGSLVCAGSTSSAAVRESPMNLFKHWPKMEHYKGFTDAEFDAWRAQVNAFPGAAAAQLEVVKSLTNSIPNELKSLAFTVVDMTKFDEQTLQWTLQRKDYIKLRIGEWRRITLLNDEADMKAAARAAVFMHAEAPVVHITDYIRDERFMLPAHRGKMVVYDDGGPQHIVGVIAPLTEVIGEAIYEYWRDHMGEIVVNSIVDILKGGAYTNDTKGRLWEKIIIDGLVDNAERGLRIPVVQLGVKKGRAKKDMVVDLLIPKFDEVVMFRGLDVPQALIAQVVRGTRRVLFVPLAPNYPFNDLFLWDGEADTLWAVQITLCTPISGHEKPGNTFFTANVRGGRDQWRAQLQAATGRAPQVLELWVGTNDDTHANWQHRDYFCHIREFSVVESPLLRECIDKAM